MGVSQAIKVGNTWTNILSSKTGESVNYLATTKWFDGSDMDDTKVDGVIYRKKGTEYLKMVYPNTVNVRWFGAVGDGVTDDTFAIQQALSTGRTIYFQEPTVGYKVSTIRPQRGQLLYGDGMYRNGIIGNGTDTTIQVGNGVGTIRMISLFNLNITNDGAKCVDVNYSPNFDMTNCRVISKQADTVKLYYSWRATIKNCYINCEGSYTAISCLNNVNGLVINGNTLSGGRYGRALNVGESQSVSITNNIIEGSYHGIWVSSDTGSGNCNGVNICNNYIEQSSTPIVIGTKYSVIGVTCSNNFISNMNTTIVADRTASITIGRIRGGQITDNSMIVHSTEDLYHIYLPFSDTNCQQLTVARNYYYGSTPANLFRLFGDYAANTSVLRMLGSNNDFNFANNFKGYNSSEIREYVTGNITANVGIPVTSWIDYTKLIFGGKIFDVSVIDKQGDVTGATLSIGRQSSITETVNQVDISTLTYTNGKADVALVTESPTIYATESNNFRVQAGTGTGTFRIKIRYRVN